MLPLYLLLLPLSEAILYPYESPSRQTKSLDGLWRFKLDPKGLGHTEEWFKRSLSGNDVLEMPVPSSYNDIGTDSNLRVGSKIFKSRFKLNSQYCKAVSTFENIAAF